MLIPLFVMLSASKISTFTEEEVHFPGAGGIVLSGTLVRPPASIAPPRPAVLLLSGSGPTDRDGNSLALGVRTDLHKQIAERLATEGIASLRFDKRAVHRYQDVWPKDMSKIADYFDWENFVGDATGAYRFLRSQPGIDPARVSICGHSEGGLIALQIVNDLNGRPEEPGTVVLLSTAGRPLGPVIHDQVVRGVAVLPPDAAKKLIDYTDLACAALAAGKNLPPNTPPELAALFNASALKIMGAYCRIDPATYAAGYRGDVLIVNGVDDTQVLVAKDTPRLKEAFTGRSHGTVEVKLIPGVSHNFKSTADGNKDAFGGPASPTMLDAVARFLKLKLGA